CIHLLIINESAPNQIYTLSLHDALPISNVLNQWSSTCTNLCGDSNADLAAGLYGYEFACAAEIMRNYSGWAAADVAQFQSFMLKDRKSTRLNSSHDQISYAVFCLKKKNK